MMVISVERGNWGGDAQRVQRFKYVRWVRSVALLSSMAFTAHNMDCVLVFAKTVDFMLCSYHK